MLNSHEECQCHNESTINIAMSLLLLLLLICVLGYTSLFCCIVTPRSR